MLRLLRSPRRAHGILIVMIGLLLLSALSPQATLAATKQQEINNALGDFKNGQFQRASLANVVRPNTTDKVADKLGAVQLGPVGLLKQWTSSTFRMPRQLYQMGAATIGTRIFVIGGLQGTGLGSQRLAEVTSAAVSPLDGALLDPGWQLEPSLPAVQGSIQTSPVDLRVPQAAVRSPAVASVETDAINQNGYIYVIGGNAAIGTFDFSSFAVRIGTVVNGRITGWQEQLLARIPEAVAGQPFTQLGTQSAIAVSHKIGGNTYVYLIGGLQRYYNGGTATSSGLKTVFYARVRPSDGKLVKPSGGGEGWDRAASIPLPVGAQGLWDAAATADNYVASNQTAADAIYVIGGQTNPEPAPAYSASVYGATIASNGALTWNIPTGTMPTPRNAAGGVAFRGNIYVTGGLPNGQPTPDRGVLTSYVEDSLALHQFDTAPPGTQGIGTNFLKSDVLLAARAYHGSVVVRSDDASTNSGFVYMLGGIGPDGGDQTNTPRNTVIYGKIGGSEDVSTTGFAQDGWYYSTPFDVATQFGTQVQVQEIDWTTVVTRTSADMDISLDYRLSISNNCATATWGGWIPLDGLPADATHTSANGQNITTIPNPTARCLQYRAYLSTTSATATPLLLNVSVKIVVPGNPDINLKSFAPRRDANGALTGLTVVVQNLNQANPNQTLPASFDAGGSFFVDLCVFRPGQAVSVPPLPWSDSSAKCTKAYADINKSLLGPKASYTITNWYDPVKNTAIDPLSLFPTVGTYQIKIVSDSYGYIDEGGAGSAGEQNNISQTFTVNVSAVRRLVMIPFVRR